jgi:hypothetical protein
MTDESRKRRRLIAGDWAVSDPRGLGGIGLARLSIHQPLALCAPHDARGALRVIDAQLRPVVVPEIKF